jgi:hypothetical protein
MNTIAVQTESKLVSATVESEQNDALEALKELSTIELAYVGGGTGSVCFL